MKLYTEDDSNFQTKIIIVKLRKIAILGGSKKLINLRKIYGIN